MSRRHVIISFAREEDVLGATLALRQRGWHLRINDIYTPYAVHGLDEAAGLRPTRLAGTCFALGFVGLAFMLWLEFWTSTTSWPINVGGKPWNSLPAFVPVAFEAMVLMAGAGTFIAFLVVSGLRPGKPALTPAAGATDDRFVLVLEQTDATFDPVHIRDLMRSFNAIATEERVY